jgi:hypothetical protein
MPGDARHFLFKRIELIRLAIPYGYAMNNFFSFILSRTTCWCRIHDSLQLILNMLRNYAQINFNTMRKVTHIIIILFIITTVTVSQAQTLIPKVGLTISTLAIEESNDPENQYSVSSNTGFTFGVGYNFPVANLGQVAFSLQPEATYIQKGFKGKTTGEFVIGEQYYQVHATSSETINYFEIPILAKFEYGNDKLKVALYTGPSIGFGLGGKYKTTNAVDTGEGIEHYDSEGKIIFYNGNEENRVELDHNVDFGIQGGASFTFFNHVALDVRYGKGLTNLNHGDKSRNNVLQFTIGVPIRL